MTKYIVLICLSLLFVRCGGGEVDSNCEFDVQVMISHFADDIIIPNYKDFKDKTQELNATAIAFASEPNQAQLEQLRSDWKTAYLAYQEISAFEFGPARESGFSFRERLNVFPTNGLSIEEQITNNNTDIEAQFKSVVGFPAIEYLLFQDSETSTVLTTFEATDTGANRLAYLTALTTDIATKSALVYDAWVTDYRTTFVNNIGSADGSAMHWLVNEYLYDYELLKNFKFKLPLGVFDGGIVQPQKTEGFYSGISLELAKVQLDNIIDLYKGISANGQDGDGLYEYLICLKAGEEDGELLADAILEQYETIQTQLNALNDPLSERLSDQKEAVSNLHIEFQKNVPLLKREMAAALGVKISYQDADGD